MNLDIALYTSELWALIMNKISKCNSTHGNNLDQHLG